MRRIEWEKSDAKPVDASDNHVDPPLYTDDSDEELEGGPQAGAGHDERYPFGGLLSDIWRDRAD